MKSPGISVIWSLLEHFVVYFASCCKLSEEWRCVLQCYETSCNNIWQLIDLRIISSTYIHTLGRGDFQKFSPIFLGICMKTCVTVIKTIKQTKKFSRWPGRFSTNFQHGVKKFTKGWKWYFQHKCRNNKKYHQYCLTYWLVLRLDETYY